MKRWLITLAIILLVWAVVNIAVAWVDWLHADSVLPVRPIWPGFALSTLFYAVALSLVICGPFALYRLLRRCRRPIDSSTEGKGG